MDSGKSIRKGKKKQVKEELDRIKQAEKKKRRLEKALATSAAIISELEKKKQKKKEEQQRLDEEGAAIAEAVALQVLVGEEDSDHDDNVNDDVKCRRHQGFYGNRNEGFGWILNAHGGSRCEWNGYGYGYGCGDDVSSDAAHAVSCLRIGDDEDMNSFVFNRMVRG